jgi:predicted unusual protein kinase regulating ubiquinone biosynthesis (AarF/ABC1/UbiB family)
MPPLVAQEVPAGPVSRTPAETVLNLARLAPGDSARLLDIVLTLARHGVLVVARRGPYLVLRVRDRGPRALAVALRRSFGDLGPAFVKLGQLVASSPGLFPDTLSSEMRRLLDAVPAEPAERVRRTIEDELGAPIAELFAEFDDAPIAAASIAQVHQAWLHDGRKVAVKVRRPRLGSRLRRDVRLMRLLAGLLQRAGTLGELANPAAIVDDFAAGLWSELDFRNEAAAMVEFDANLDRLAGRERVVVPLPVDGMVSERVIVMTFVEGVPVDRLTTERHGHLDWEDLLRVGVRAWMHGALEFGLFHGDVHAGNLFVTQEGKVAFLDFGIMGRLDGRVRSTLRDALPAVLLEGDFARMVQAFFELGATTGPIDVERAAGDMQELMAPLLSAALSDISYGEILAQVLKVATRHRVRLPREMVLVVKQLLYFERYAKEMAPDYMILADPDVVSFLLGAPAASNRPVTAPILTARPRSRPLVGPRPGLVVVSEREAAFSWDYTGDDPALAKLYSKAKRSQWNVTTDVDWSIEVDPLDTGGLADYLPMIASDAFARFNDRERAEAAYGFNAWITSQFLHGEQGALLATAKLVQQVPDMDAKFYGATQVTDEARHVEAYARYLDEKLEKTYPVNANLQQLLELIIGDPRWDVTYLGMQIIVEGLALAAFGLIHQFSSEPLIKQITRYVMADEARHVAFGTLALDGVYVQMSTAERREREDFVLEAAWLMRDRFLAEELWAELGIDQNDGLVASMRTPMLQLFQRVLFAKITPNLSKIGLLTTDLRARLVDIGAIAGDGC